MEPLLYWYSFTFLQYINGVTSYHSRAYGFDTNFVTTARINWAKQHCSCQENASMLDCSYLGRMTKTKFEGGE